MSATECDIAVVGAGAAGLMAAIHAKRADPALDVACVDGAKKLGAKILVAGGGRCNVTNETVTPADFYGAPPHAVRKVIGRFDVARTIAFFEALGVELKREPLGKLFPTTDSARTVLDALLDAACDAGVSLRHPFRVAGISSEADGFRIESSEGSGLSAGRVVLATGGCSLPRSGSDGAGYELARALGHAINGPVFPALVPLALDAGNPLCALSGISTDVTLTLVSSTGKRLFTHGGSLLCTHFGLSGPVVLDMSRHLTAAKREDPGAHLTCNWIADGEVLDAAIRNGGARTADQILRGRLPGRLLASLLEAAGDTGKPAAEISKVERRALVAAMTALPLYPTGDRGWNHAEVTAGGLPLSELNLKSMESRVCPGLFACGEICDVDGRIGGFNFQWAWSSGAIAGSAAAGETKIP